MENFIEKTDAGKKYVEITYPGFQKIFAGSDVLKNPVQAAALLGSFNSGFKQSGMSQIAISAFLGQVSHESGRLKYFEEIANGEAYEGRGDLGNKQKGDGRLYKGRGPMMITGRINYEAFQQAIARGDFPFLKDGNSRYPNIVTAPQLLTTNMGVAVASTFWYWQEGYKITMANKNRTYPFKVNGQQQIMTPADYMKQYFKNSSPTKINAIDTFDSRPLSYAADNGLFGIVTGAINAAYNHANERVQETNRIRAIFKLAPMPTAESNIAIPRPIFYDIIKANRQKISTPTTTPPRTQNKLRP
jgi:predicted chitinase